MKIVVFVAVLSLVSSANAADFCPVPPVGKSTPGDLSSFRLGIESIQGTQDYVDHLKKQVDPCPAPWHCGTIDFHTSVMTAEPVFLPLLHAEIDPLFLAAYADVSPPAAITKKLSCEHEVSAQLRAGYLPENPAVPFKGDVIYYEGLGDSMLNHAPLFEKLTGAGYRVVAFDYMGQGGSTGDMDDTRIKDIPKIGSLAWKQFARNPRSKPTIIGWSTGGLAAYYAAHSDEAGKVVLIAPGIAPNSVVGENHRLPFKVDSHGVHGQKISLDQITLGSLDSQRDAPPIEPVRPSSPLYVADFALDLQATAKEAREMKIPQSVCGFTMLSGDEDTYVDPGKTREVLSANAPRFNVRQYPGTLHEIQDDQAAPTAHEDIRSFIGSDCRR